MREKRKIIAMALTTQINNEKLKSTVLIQSKTTTQSKRKKITLISFVCKGETDKVLGK